MKTVRHKTLEIVFSDSGQFTGVFQGGRLVTDKKREDFLIAICIDGTTYTDAKDFCFKEFRNGENKLEAVYTLKDAVDIVLHFEERGHFIKVYADILKNTDSAEFKYVSDITFQLPAVKYDSIEKDLFHAPGQGACYEVTSGNITFAPDMKTGEMRDFACQEDMYSTTPDKGAGLLVVEREDESACIGFAPYSDRENFFPMTSVSDRGIYLKQRNKLIFNLRKFSKMRTGNVYIFSGDCYTDILKAYRSFLNTEISLTLPKAPKWLTAGGILEVSMNQLGDFKKAQAYIEQFYDLGIRTIYLMPCMKFQRPSIYCTIDYYEVDPAFGGNEAFLEFVQKLHTKGMRILMDFVPQGTARSSKLADDHPEWYERDKNGERFGSHGWEDTLSLDWANPDVQQFFIDMACYFVREFDIDGYRIDAPHWKEPNWDEKIPYHASYPCFGSVRLLKKMLAHLMHIKPDIALLCEVWGVIFQDVTHAVCEYNIHWALYNTALLKFSGRQLQKWLACYQYTQPKNSPKVVFLETHDTRLLTPPAQRMRGAAVTEVLMTLAVFMGFGSMIWYEELGRRSEYYKRLLKFRDGLADELDVWADTEAVKASDSGVFCAARSRKTKMLFLANLGSYPAKVRLDGAEAFFGMEKEQVYRLRLLHTSGNYQNISEKDADMEISEGGFEEKEFLLEACAGYWWEIKEEASF